MKNWLWIVTKKLFCLLWCCMVVVSCGEQGKKDAATETETSGTVELYCDESLIPFMKPVFQMFDSAYHNAHVTVKPLPAREAMAQLFSGKSRGIIIARGYLPDEDSLMKVHKVSPHKTVVFAQDALVFVVHPSFPLDTVSFDQIKEYFKGNLSLRHSFSQLKTEPRVICPPATSSEYGNLMLKVTGSQAPKKIAVVPSAEEVAEQVRQNPDMIGVGYLSRYAGMAHVKSVKLLKIGFTDTSGTYISPKVVHQANVVMGKYPLVVSLTGLLLEDRITTLPSGFFTFIRHDKQTKEYFLKSGIVPDNARFNLVPDDDN